MKKQYADFAQWQRDSLQGHSVNEHIEYWRKQLAGAPAVLDLSITKSRPAMQTFRGAHLTKMLPRDLNEAIAEFSRREGVTVFMTLLAVFKILLYRYSGQDDVVVGSPIAGRNREETENLIGFFVNSLPLRTTFSGDLSFRELLSRVKETALGAYAHQDLPFEKIVEELQPERSLSYPPIFQVMFALQNQPRAAFSLPGLLVEPLKRETDSAKFDMTFFATETANGLACWLEYNPDLFEHAAIERLLRHFATLAEAAMTKLNTPVAELPLMDADEGQQLLVTTNATATEFAPLCLHRILEAQVERSPDSVAAVFEQQQLTYAELNRRANQLANYLRRRGVGPEVLIGVCLERSVEMVVALLAVLKAGGAYVALDPSNPRERLSFMLADAAAPVLLTQERLLADLPQHDAEAICLDRDWPNVALESEQPPNSGVVEQNPAYVIYTSGSTGKPKGVVVTHEAISNHMHWMQNRFPLTENDCILQKTPIGFDASVWEFYAPLMAGARLIIAKPGGHQDVAYLVRVIRQNQVTVLQLVPTLLRFLLDEPGFETCDSLRRVYCGGEQLTRDLVERFQARHSAEL